MFLCVLCGSNQAEAKQPNIILVITDDQGYADVGIYGSDNVDTPHIDQLAKDGIKFKSF